MVLGANDVVNPSARSDTGSPIYGMPILDVDKAGAVVVVKRSMSPGFAGIDNPLFYDPKTVMLFADAKGALEQIGAALKSAVSRRSRSSPAATSSAPCRRSARSRPCATPSSASRAASGRCSRSST